VEKKPSAKEEKYMAIKKALIKRETSKTTLVLEVNGKKFEIILTDDNPNNVKSVFNSLLKELKKELIQFNLEDSKSDLYSHICKEYIKQLNAELKAVHSELKEFGLFENKLNK
jgi:hypothetical protein